MVKNGPKFDNIFNKGVKYGRGYFLTPLLNLLHFLDQPLTRESMCTWTAFFEAQISGRKNAVVVHMLSRVRGWMS